MSDTEKDETHNSDNKGDELPADTNRDRDTLGETDFSEADKSEKLEEVQKEAAEERKEGGYQ